MLFAGGRTHLQTYKLTYTQIFSQYLGISSHSFGCSYIFEGNDSDDKVDVSNCKSPPESIAVQENNGVCHATNTVTDGMQNIPPPHKSVAVSTFNTNDDHENVISSSTISFVAISYSLKIGGFG
jgi:hypothetical protein